MLYDRRVLLCVTGGVAAYKSAYLARRLVESGADVRVAMSESALEFIGAQTFAAITGSQPATSLFSADSVSPHTDMAQWADLVVVAPATAATLGCLAAGISSEVVSATLLATRAPVLLAPAMHTEMWKHPATQRNITQLRSDGHELVGPVDGALAGGDSGMGRMAEPEEILEASKALLAGDGASKKVLITAGGTREPIDPVRFLGNRSSGKMGHAVADEAVRRGYHVTLVTTSDLGVHPAAKVINVETAAEMLDAVSGVETEIAVMTAAVADFRPSETHETKLTRSDGLDSIDLLENPDILATVVARNPRPYVVGFAAETGGVERAAEKAERKDVDLIVYNDVAEPGSGFGSDNNRVVFIAKGGAVHPLPLLTKREVAGRLWDRVSEDINATD